MEDKITCLQCHSRINGSAHYCESCGSKVTSVKKNDHETGQSEVLDEVAKPKVNDNGQNLILVALILLCSTTFYYFLLNIVIKSTQNWNLYETMEPVSIFISVLGIGIALLFAFGMNKGARKTVAIILASVYTLIQLYWLLERIIPDDSPFQFLNF